jgi:hypothetical protein
MFVQVWHYFYLVWFKSDEYLQQLRNDKPQWYTKLGFVSSFRNSPYALPSARLTTLFCLVLSIPMLVLVSWATIATWLEWSTLFG